MLRKPAFWVALTVVSAASTAVAVRLFPSAFSIVQLEITMDREGALAAAREIMRREGLGPPGYRQAASFSLDSEAQTFVELEGGGKEAFTRMLRDGLYAAYAWRVRHFREGEKNETLIRFRPDGQPYGFEERLREDAPGAALTPEAARALAEKRGRASWNIDLTPYTLVEQSHERRPSGRIDHTFTYERRAPVLNEGRYRLRLVVSGDRLTEATHFIKIPDAFSRRYQEMRAANEAIGLGSAIAMLLLYVVGGIAVSLFFLLRQRWVVARPALLWGVGVAGLQALSSLNNWPLMWMEYDTALSRATFIGQQLATLAASFVGFAILFGFSFMAAESLTRRAFGHHPRLWQVWSVPAAASTSVLGQTAGGYLLVGIFFAYEVLLYFYATRLLGWWAPSEALIHPDVLATYFPWLSAIANSFQAGFWEECLFRAVPLAGAALIGDRFGTRRLAIAIAMVTQAIVFGAGHAPYPTQPSYARPVELMIPSIGFGLLYLAFGLLPGIVLHFAFDVVWFALPLFVSSASGVWIDRLMVIALTLVPLWVVLGARRRAGRWSELPETYLNRTWTPPPVPAVAQTPPPVVTREAFGPRAILGWIAAGVTGLVAWVAIAEFQTDIGPLPVSRRQAEQAARSALAVRGMTLGPGWRVMPVPENGQDDSHRYVWEHARPRFRDLLGRYLATPHWRVRIATFQGDQDTRAEEWIVLVNERGKAERVGHVLPEARPAASLGEVQARALALRTIQERFSLEPAKLREVSASPSKLPARTDWVFTFEDLTVPPIPLPGSTDRSARAEARVEVAIAGREVVRARPFIHLPEQWERRRRAEQTTARIVQIISSALTIGLVVTAAILAIIAWSRGRFARPVFLAVGGLVLLVSAAGAVNEWPSLVAQLLTQLPFRLQLAMLLGAGTVALLVMAGALGLAAGALPRWMGPPGLLAERPALALGVAAGLAGAALSACASWLRTPPGPTWPTVEPLGNLSPVAAAALGPITDVVSRSIVLLLVFTALDRLTGGWTKRRLLWGGLMVVAGILLGAAPAAGRISGWLAAGALTGAALLAAYVWLFRRDLTLVPIAVAMSTALDRVREAAQRAFPGALAGGLAAAVLVLLVGFWLFRLLRRASDLERAGSGPGPAGQT